MNSYENNFIDIVLSSGVIGITIWFGLFILIIVGTILGINSIINSTKVKENKYPLAFKLLFPCIATTILMGAMGTVTGYVDGFAGLASATGASKAEMLQYFTKQSRICFFTALFAALGQFIFMVISWIIFNTKLKRLSIPHQSLTDYLKKIPVLIYFVILASFPTVTGIFYSIWAIEKIILLKPAQTLPTIFGMELATMLTTCFVSGLVGIIVLLDFLMIISTSDNSDKTPPILNL